MIPQMIPAPSSRLTIHRFASAESSDTFARDVRAGLTSNPKWLLPKYFYDDLGSYLFEAICCLPEYYLTRSESEILRHHIGEIISTIEAPAQSRIRLIELGNGNSIKTHYIIEALRKSYPEIHYLPIDISAVSLERSSEELLQLYPRLRITAYAADYPTALRALAVDGRDDEGHQRNIVLFLGSSIGNLDPTESRALLRKIRAVLRRGDVLYLGADLKKSADVLAQAYDDALGVTAAFNLNLLMRINRELDGDFDVKKFAHRAIYNEQPGRIEMHLISREAQTAQIRAIDTGVDFASGESIHTENSYKYDLPTLSKLARDTGFSLEQSWFDSARRFSFNLFAAIDAPDEEHRSLMAFDEC